MTKKTLKTCYLSLPDDSSHIRRVESILLKHDYLILPGPPADLYLIQNKTDFLFKENKKLILQIPVDDFLQNPKKILKEFSQKTDRHIFFREATFFSILFSLAVCLYFLVYLFFYKPFELFFKQYFVSVRFGIFCLIICLIIGGGCFIFLSFGKKNDFHTPEHISDHVPDQHERLAQALASEDCYDRVDALRFIYQKRLEIAQFPSYLHTDNHPCIIERYHLAKALGRSRSPETYPLLLGFLDDKNFNVVYNAFASIGKRGKKEAIPEIEQRIKGSDNWYVQWYAYRALRRLGWTQSK